MATTKFIPLALKDAPTLIETVFPAQKISFEAQAERKSGQAQTLTGLGSFWKGRKPLILVRAIILGSLLAPTDNAQADLAIFEKLMAFDDEGLARRAVAANAYSVAALRNIISIENSDRYFNQRGWKRQATRNDRLPLFRQALATLSSYEEKASLGKRPEEVDQEWLYAPVWPQLNFHYAHLGVNAQSFSELVKQFGILRYGYRPIVGDSFSGSGSIAFEAARIGCDVYASDLNPIACMLTWGAFNVVGTTVQQHEIISAQQAGVAYAVDKEITQLGIEHDEHGNRAKAYLYCLETCCPETQWRVPMAPSWVISRTKAVVAVLIPNHAERRFDIQIKSGVSDTELVIAETGTVQGQFLVYVLDGKTYRVAIKTIRGDYSDRDGLVKNRLRQWEKSDFQPHPGDIFQERLYAIQWITKETLGSARQNTYFAAPTAADLEREKLVQKIVAENLCYWQSEGWVSDMEIEPGYNTQQPIRERGWTYWHHLFNARQIHMLQCILRHGQTARTWLASLGILNLQSKLCAWHNDGRKGGLQNTFSNQALNTLFNWGSRGFVDLVDYVQLNTKWLPVRQSLKLRDVAAEHITEQVELWITDPPYADAVNYHEITEFFIAWLRKKPPKPFDDWVWDSRRVLALKGSGDDFRRGMVSAYKVMANHMPNNGMQCVMFTHQDSGVWSDLIGIFWAVGLQVVAAWYIATETTSELKKGGYVQGTVILMLKKRQVGERNGFKQRLLPAVRQEVASQIEAMMHLNDTVKAHYGEPVFNDADLQMAGYAAALKVLTAYTHIGGEDVTNFALRPRIGGETTVVDEIVQQATETASNLLVPKGLTAATWVSLVGIERFVLRMMDMEITHAVKLDDYQNFAKAFRVGNYSSVMGDMRPGHARLKRLDEYASHELTASTEIGSTRLGHLISALQQLNKDTEPKVVVEQMQTDLANFLEIRHFLVDILAFIEQKLPQQKMCSHAGILGARLKNLRLGD
jgi:adenine-specific DNA methylase